MTLNDLEQDVLRRFGFNTSSVDAATKTRIDGYLNETQQEILSEPGMESLLRDRVTFASVASTPEYSVPPMIASVEMVRETTNDRRLSPMTYEEYLARYPDPTASTATPDRWVDMGYAAVATQPSDASQLFVDSTSASDTGTAYVEGYRTGGYFRSVSVTVTGITAVSIATAITDWIQITKFYMSAAAVGTVTLVEDAEGGTVLATIPIGQTQAKYHRIALAICPSAAVTYTVEGLRDVPSMSVANDEPVIPARFHRLLAIGARMREYEKQDDLPRHRAAQAEYLFGLRKMKQFVYGSAVGALNLGGLSRGRNSRLGAWYPIGS